MYAGWLVLGVDDPTVASPDLTDHEIVNSPRAYAYAKAAGCLPWLRETDDCPASDVHVPGALEFLTPKLDPAPWYDAANPDSEGFLGVIGLDIAGDESSTRQLAVTSTITGGGVIGAPYYGPRTLVLRGVVIATAECSLQVGLEWIRRQITSPMDPCSGDRLTFYGCCPGECPPATPGVCWPTTYAELRDGPPCKDDVDDPPGWWPATYGELKEGPDPIEQEDSVFCVWARYYSELRDGPPDWLCALSGCVLPYIRQYTNVAVTQGPVILRHPSMSKGAMAEFEMTLVAASPWVYALPQPPLSLLYTTGVPLGDGWEREEEVMPADPRGALLSSRVVSLNVVAALGSGAIRIGVWNNGTRLAGYLIEGTGVGTEIDIDALAERVHVEAGTLTGLVTDWDGSPVEYPRLPFGPYRLTVDQEVGLATSVTVTMTAYPVGS